MQDLFDAVSISSIFNNVVVLLIGFIGIHLVLLAYKFVRRSVREVNEIEL